MLESGHTLNLDNSKTLLDVVFGIVIALPLSRLPEEVLRYYNTKSPDVLIIILLMVSTIVFCAFYWDEVRYFLNNKMSLSEKIERDGIGTTKNNTPIEVFLLGLVMIAFAAGILYYAEHNHFRAFLWANLAYWVADFIGALFIRHSLKPQANKQHQNEEVNSWIEERTESWFIPCYCLLNALVFLTIIILNELLNSAINYRIVVAAFIMIYTLFRHILWRKHLFYRWLQRKKLPQKGKKISPATASTNRKVNE